MSGDSVKFGAFNESFFENANNTIRWFDKKGVLKLNNGLIATITIVTHGTGGHYEGYNVKFVSKEKEIDAHYFSFKTYLHKAAEIIDYCCDKNVAEWYGIKPTFNQIDNMAKEIIDYINTYEHLN